MKKVLKPNLKSLQIYKTKNGWKKKKPKEDEFEEPSDKKDIKLKLKKLQKNQKLNLLK